jgi:hypothetical protein
MFSPLPPIFPVEFFLMQNNFFFGRASITKFSKRKRKEKHQILHQVLICIKKYRRILKYFLFSYFVYRQTVGKLSCGQSPGHHKIEKKHYLV